MDEWSLVSRNLTGLHRVLTSTLTNVLLEEWSKDSINTLLNLVESLTRRVEAVIDGTSGPTPY